MTLVEIDPVHDLERSVPEESREMFLIGVEVLAIRGQMPRAFGIEKAQILIACDAVASRDGYGPDSSAGWLCQMDQSLLVESCIQE